MHPSVEKGVCFFGKGCILSGKRCLPFFNNLPTLLHLPYADLYAASL